MVYKDSNRLLITQILLVVTLFLYLLLKNKGAPVFIFWPIFWSIVIVSLFIILVSEKKYKVISLVILEIALCSIVLVSTPSHFQLSRDVYFESEYASTIVDNGRWDPEAGVGFAENYYGYNPVLHFILAFSAIATGLTTYALSKYVYFIVFRVILVLSAVLFISSFFKKDKERIIYLAAFIFIASFGMSFVEISRRLIADIFLLLALYALVKKASQPGKIVWDLLFYVFSALVVMGNHSIAYLLLLIILGIWLFGFVARTKVFNKIFPIKKDLDNTYPLALPNLIFLFDFSYLWGLLVAVILLKNDLRYVETITSLIKGGFGVKLLVSSAGSKAATFIYHLYETRVLYLYHITFVLLGSIGLLLFMIKLRSKSSCENKTTNKTLLLFMGISSIAMYVLAFTLIRSELDSAAYTFLWLFCIPISMFIAYVIDEVYTKGVHKNFFIIFVIMLSILFYTGHAFSGIYTPRITNRALDEDIVNGMDMRAKTPELYYSAYWLSRNADGNSKVIGDVNVFEMYSGLFEFDVSTDIYNLANIYNGTLEQFNDALSSDRVYFGSYKHTVHYAEVDYVIIDKKFFILPSEMFGEPVDIKKSEKFGLTKQVDKVYDNKEISIYRNNK